MDFISRFPDLFSDDRLGANLVAAHGLITLTVLVSLLVQRLVLTNGSRFLQGTGWKWLTSAGEEAVRRGRRILVWMTAAMLFVTVAGGIAYHLAGRDIRQDVAGWYEHLTGAEIITLGLRAGAFLGTWLAARIAVRVVRFVRPRLEHEVRTILGRVEHDTFLQHWFNLLQHYAVVSIRLGAVWILGRIVGLAETADAVCGFLLQVWTILVLARLLVLSCRLLSWTLRDLGDRRLGQGPFVNYWDRGRRLFAFGERCCEAAVYVMATSLCVRQLSFIATVAAFGPRIVQCIGIFFSTRVLIELLQVLLMQAFGLADEEQTDDQKGRTLAPLLYSVSQYVLYFGSALVMLGVLGVDTRPILAGAGILGLAVGLGAQSLVTDVVSGFFILFENQYLVGDFVQIGDASGVVEAVGIRVTQIRDGQGKVYILPNGQIKGVVSYSKGYVNAVVDLKVPSGSDLERIFRAMTEAGRRLRQGHREVLGDTHIQGLVELDANGVTVRAVTKVRPGAHIAMQYEYRRLLKQVLDQDVAGKSALAA